MHLSDLFDPELLLECLETGLVSERPHPTDPLVIYNYTKECQFGHFWNDCTTECRGLIATLDGEVVARPFPKFFNWGEPDAPELPLTARARVTDKLDGSLGILYPCPSGVPDGYHAGARWAIATRGSFDSEQAHVANAILTRYLDGTWLPLHGLTYLFEIVYPENRIVVDYGQTRDLFLLAVINNRTGENLGLDGTSWRGPRTETFEYSSLAEALAAPYRPNREGLVVEIAGQVRVKIKQEDYVALHRLVTGLNARVVWEQIGAGATLDEILEPLPEEFHEWVKEIATDLCIQAGKIEHEAQTVFTGIQNVLTELGDRWTRKDFALEAQKPAYADVRPYLFMLLDGKPRKTIQDAIWKTLKPAGGVAPRDFAEAA